MLPKVWGLQASVSQIDGSKVSGLLGHRPVPVPFYHYLICIHLQWGWDKLRSALNPFSGIKFNKKKCRQDDRLMKSSCLSSV